MCLKTAPFLTAFIILATSNLIAETHGGSLPLQLCVGRCTFCSSSLGAWPVAAGVLLLYTIYIPLFGQLPCAGRCLLLGNILSKSCSSPFWCMRPCCSWTLLELKNCTPFSGICVPIMKLQTLSHCCASSVPALIGWPLSMLVHCSTRSAHV